jgi:hypothetical protein
VNPGEIWQAQNGARRIVLSPATYNAGPFHRVITALVTVPTPEGEFDPFAVDTDHGTVRTDLLAMHPRDWLTAPVARIDDASYATVRRHLSFLLNI